MVAHPPPHGSGRTGVGLGGGAIVTHRATQMSASVGVPSTLESPKDPMLLRAEAQTRIERPLGSGHASQVPSTLEDVDSTMPDNAARDAAIRDAARAADERAGMPSDSGSKRFGPPTLQSPNDGGLPSSPAASLAGVVVDAILPSAAFARPEPPPTAPTHGGEPPPLPGTGGSNGQPVRHPNVVGPGAPGAPGYSGTAAMGPQGHGAATGGPDGRVGAAQLAGTGGPGAGSGPPPYLGGIGGAAMGSVAPNGYPQSGRASSPAAVPQTRSGSTTVVVVVVVMILVVVGIAVVGVGLYLRARNAQLAPAATAPSSSLPAAGGKRAK